MANPWYRTGTVTVTNNSKNVTGVGTLFIVNAVANGDILFAPDGKAYEVDTVQNDTLIVLKSVYLGATESAQPYGIVRFVSQSPISLANIIVDKTVKWEALIDQHALYLSGDATTTVTAPENLCVNYSLGEVKTGIAEVDCPIGFTYVASAATLTAGWFLFSDTVGNYRVAQHPETFKAEITAIKDLAATSESNTNADAIATAADRVQTGLDATATAADVVTISGSEAATTADAVATAADKVATNADAAQTAIDATTATDQATISTNQATISTTQAGLSDDARVLSETARDVSLVYRNDITSLAADYANFFDYKPSVNPTIALDFANQNYQLYTIPGGLSDLPLTSIVDVIRSSTSKYTDPTGLVRTAGVNVPRNTYEPVTGEPNGLLVEESRTNLFGYPTQLENWSLVNFPIISKAVEAPDGSLSATRFDATGATGLVRDTISLANTYPSLSIYVKGIQGESLKIETRASNSSVVQQFQFIFTGEWQRVDNSSVLSDWSLQTDATVYSGIRKDVVNTATVFDLWHAQLEAGSLPTSTIPDATIFNSRATPKKVYDSTGNLVEVGIDVAPYTYNPANLRAEPYLLLEVASTNLLANRDVMATETVTVVSGQTYTLSFDGLGSVQLSGADTGNVVGTGSYPNEIRYTFVAATTSLTLTVTGSCLLGQVENLPYRTSFIPDAVIGGARAADLSTGVQAIRSGDSSSIDLSLIDGWNPNEFSIYGDILLSQLSGRALSIGSSATNRIELIPAGLVTQVNGAPVRTINFASPLVTGTRYKILYTFTNIEIRIYVNGILYGTTTVDGSNMNAEVLRINSNVVGSVLASLTCRDAVLYPKALSEAECIALTS